MPELQPRVVRVLLLGFGNVGQAVARLLLQKAPLLKERYGLTVVVLGIATGSHGTVAARDETGLDLEACLAAASGESWTLPCASADCQELSDAAALLEFASGRCEAVLECINSSHEDGQPAVSYLEAALKMAPPAHAITASKPPVALAYGRLTALAAERDRRFLFESSLMDGVPIFSLLRQLPGAQLRCVRGVLNSTTNIILTRMRDQRCSMDEALAFAQEQGIAERDPSDDLDGKDAAVKLACLCAVAFGRPLREAELFAAEAAVPKESIRGVTLEQVELATSRGHSLKVVCEAALTDEGEVQASVALKELPLKDPLACLEGASSAISFETDVLGPVTVTSTDPTNTDTAFGLLQDLLNAVLGDGQGLARSLN